MYESAKKIVIGKTIAEHSLDEGGTILTLHLESGSSLIFEAEGDCCSESWIEHVTVPKFPAKILSIEEKELGEAPGTKQEYDKKYSTVFKTDQGDFEVEYRNSSNGYYGGDLKLLGYDWEGNPI